MNAKPLFVLVAIVASCGQVAPEPVEPASETVDFSDDMADRLDQLRVRADGMTVWAEPRVLSENDWLFSVRSSHSLTAIDATIGDSSAQAQLVSARKFEVRLSAAQMENNLGEVPLFVHLETSSGRDYHVMLGARARFVETTGSSKLYPWKNIEPITVGRDRVFRGRVTTPDDFVFVGGWNDDDSEPIVTQEDATHWMLDWYPGMLAWAAHPTEDALDLVGDSATGERYRRNAPIHMEIVKLGVSNQDPSTTWPMPECTTEVRRCLAPFDIESDDLESCGSHAEVAPCLADIPVDDTPQWIQRFAGDLRRTIIDHYRVNEQDIIAAGGNTRPQALLAVDSARIEEVLDDYDVPSGHDLDDHRVFAHPDVTFPGSDIVWYGVYERTTGDLVEVYDFN